MGLTTPLLADADQSVTKAFGVLNPKNNLASRWTFVIDKKGNIFRVREGYNPGDEKLVEADVLKVLEPAPAAAPAAP